MQNKLFLKAADICELLEVKQTSAYLVRVPYIKNISQLCFWSGCVVNQGNTFRAFLNPAVHLLVPDFHRCHCGCLWTLCIDKKLFRKGIPVQPGCSIKEPHPFLRIGCAW